MVTRKSKKSGLKSKFETVKQEIKERISFPYLLIAALVIIVVGLFVLGIKIPFGNEPPSAIVDNRAIRFLNLYYGIVNITINNKTFENNVWKLNINGYSSDGIVNIDLEMNANDFSIKKISQNLVIPSKPTTIQETGKAVGCSAGDIKTVDIYIDPYDPWTIKYKETIQNFTDKFENNINVNYRIVSTYTYQYITTNVNSSAYDALKYYECIKSKSYFREFDKCVMDKYNLNKEFLTKEELDNCVAEVGGDVNELSRCIDDDAPGILSTDLRFAETFLGKAISPMVVIDCRYAVYPAYVDNVFCYLYPNLEQCKEDQ